MGRFVLYEDKSSLGPLSLSRFRELLSRDEIDFPDVTVAQIQDRSKGDLLAKGIVAVQTSWFTVQCIAELELVTLAFAVLNGIMYFFWWDKPLDVRCPIAIQLKKNEMEMTEEEDELVSKSCLETTPVQEQDPLELEKVEAGFEEEDRSKVGKDEDVSEHVLDVGEDVERNMVGIPSNPDGTTEQVVESQEATIRTNRLTQIIQKIWDILWIILTMGLVDLLRPLDDMTQSPTSITIAPGATRVPTFYADLAGPTVLYGLDIPSAVISVIFGGIHCIGLLPRFKPPGIGRSLFHLFKRIIYISLVLYIIARLALFIQAFVSLRALPGDAHVAVDWTKFVPHVA
ncbi:hypothetical protein BDQ17DRAFT_1367668, partial [Cyathus striatus]